MEPKTLCIAATLAIGAFCISILAYHGIFLHQQQQQQQKKKKKEEEEEEEEEELKSSSAASADKKKVKVELVLEQGHHVWLQKCTEEFSLPSVDKALRILLTYAQHSGNEMNIFEQIRCNFCNNKEKICSTHTIDLVHDQYLNEMVLKHKLANKDKAMRIILDYAMTSNERAVIFEVKRCSHGDTCKNC